jgi:hypothetical protein
VIQPETWSAGKWKGDFLSASLFTGGFAGIGYSVWFWY